MTLEALVFQQDSVNYGCRDINTLGGGGGTWSYGPGLGEDKVYNFETIGNNVEQVSIANWESSPSSVVQGVKERDTNTSSSPENCNITDHGFLGQGLSSVEAPATTMGKRKRRRARRTKNEEEMENQRMTHIAVERNRRKQMNDYLTMLRSMMPPSYVQRGDQASIIGGAINFVKELEQYLQSLEAYKRIKQQPDNNLSSDLFSSFFTFPQYSTYSSESSESMTDKRSAAIADIEVTMVESHANIKVLSRKHPKQLLKMVAGLHSLHLIVLHLNVTTVENLVLYSFSVKVEDDSKLTSVNEIAAAVYKMVGWIQKEAQFT